MRSWPLLVLAVSTAAEVWSGWDRTRLGGRHGAAICCEHGVFARNLAKIGALAS